VIDPAVTPPLATRTPEVPPLMEPALVTVRLAPAQSAIGPVVPDVIVVVPTQAACAGAGASANVAATSAVLPMSAVLNDLDPNIYFLLLKIK